MMGLPIIFGSVICDVDSIFVFFLPYIPFLFRVLHEQRLVFSLNVILLLNIIHVHVDEKQKKITGSQVNRGLF